MLPVSAFWMFRLVILKLRNQDLAEALQISELHFYDRDDNQLEYYANVNITQPGGETPENEMPENVFDTRLDTKWLAFAKRRAPLILTSQMRAPRT